MDEGVSLYCSYKLHTSASVLKYLHMGVERY